MNINEYKHMYEKMEISDELDVQIRNRIMNLGENEPITVKHQHFATVMLICLEFNKSRNNGLICL